MRIKKQDIVPYNEYMMTLVNYADPQIKFERQIVKNLILCGWSTIMIPSGALVIASSQINSGASFQGKTVMFPTKNDAQFKFF